MSPAISVVIPHHNCPDLLQRALASVEAQTVPVHEVIVVDDASSDPEMAERARVVTERFPQARFLRLDSNAGPGGARNAGWDAATGEWVAFCDADDAWHPRKIERQSPLLLDGVSIVGASRVTIGQDDPWPDTPNPAVPRLITTDMMVVKNPFPTSSVIVRADLPLRFTEGRRYAEDYEVWIRAVALGRGWLLPEPLCAQYKAAYGESGLSSHMVEMVKGEFETIALVAADGCWSKAQTRKARMVLVARVARRFLLHTGRRAGFRVKHGNATVAA